MRQTLIDFGLKFDTSHILCDSTSAINLSKTFIFHSGTKHIDVRHHFLKDNVESDDIKLVFVDTKNRCRKTNFVLSISNWACILLIFKNGHF